MLRLHFPAVDEHPAVDVELEHSLLSLSKWESIHEKVFFSKDEKTLEESISYLRQMLLSPEPPDFENRLTAEHTKLAWDYVNSRQSATWFTAPSDNRPSHEVVTTELVYYWLTQFQIPFHPTETWHFNRLMTLVKIAGLKQTKPKKMSRAEHAQRMRELNEKRRQELGTAG